MKSIKLNNLQKKELEKVTGGTSVACSCSYSCSCNCGNSDTVTMQSINNISVTAMSGSKVATDLKNNPPTLQLPSNCY